jgi:hypothetical protein
MTNEEFMELVDSLVNQSKAVLAIKEREYSEGADRFDQFKKVGIMNSVSPMEALWGMASKHITSIASMVKDPSSYNLETWREKLGDLRNYTLLAEGLLRDLGVK